MTDKEFKRLSREELVDIIYVLQKQNDEKDAQIKELQATLDDRTLRLSKAGSIAEAAISVNGVFEAAQAAAEQYLSSVRVPGVSAEMPAWQTMRSVQPVQTGQTETEQQRQKILDDANRKAKVIILLAKRKAQQLVQEAEEQSAAKWADFEQKTNALLKANAELQDLLRRNK